MRQYLGAFLAAKEASGVRINTEPTKDTQRSAKKTEGAGRGGGGGEQAELTGLGDGERRGKTLSISK